MKKQKDKNRRLTGILFTAAMAACCAALCLWGSPAETEATASSAPELPAQTVRTRAYPAVEVFFDRAEEYGLSAKQEETDGFAHAKGYILERCDLPDAELVLSLRNGGVCAFTLSVPDAAKPNDLSAEPSDVEGSLYEQRLVAYELELEWVQQGFGALVSGLDIMGELTYAKSREMLSLIQQTASDGKDRSMKEGGFEFNVSRLETPGGRRISLSLEMEE